VAYYLNSIGMLALRTGGSEGDIVMSESKSLVILALLATAPDHSMKRDHLAGLLWPEAPHEKARRSLRQSLYYLAKHAGERLIDADNGQLTIADAFDCDLWQFDRLVQEGDHLGLLDGFDGRFLESMERGLGSELREWSDLTNQRIGTARRSSIRNAIGTCVERGDEETGLRLARRFAADHPLDDAAHLALIETFKAFGDEAGAFRAYEEFRTVLKAALDDVPSEEVEESIARVRAALTSDTEWKPLTAPTTISGYAITHGDARRYAAVAVGLSVVGAGLIVGFTAQRSKTSQPPNTTLDNVAVEFVVRREGDSQTLHRLSLDRGRVRLQPVAEGLHCPGTDRQVQESPHFRYKARTLVVPTGYDLEIVDCRDGSVLHRLDARADETPVDWSPDDRFALVRKGWKKEDGSYGEMLLALEVETGRLDTVAIRNTLSEPPASWSPSGSRIAYALAHSPTEIRLVGADGRNPRGLRIVGDLPIHYMAWRPSETHLAMKRGDGDGWKIDLVPIPDRQRAQQANVEMRALASGSGVVGQLFWLSNDILGYIRQLDSATAIWGVDLRSGEHRELGSEPGVWDFGRPWTPPVDSLWVDNVTIQASAIMATGETSALDVVVTNAKGDEQPERRFLVDWELADSSFLSWSGDNAVRAMGPGTTILSATINGWRRAAHEIQVVELTERDLSPSFVEDWSRELRTEVWEAFGNPAPLIDAAGGPEGRPAFVANGDQNFASGVLSRDSFDTSRGITIEAEGWVPLTVQPFQGWQLGFSEPDAPRVQGGPELWLVADVDPRNLSIAATAARKAHRHATVPSPNAPGWKTYTVQLDLDGTMTLLIDGRVELRRQAAIPPERIPDRLHVVLTGRSNEGVPKHGTVRVYEGARYVSDREAAAKTGR